MPTGSASFVDRVQLKPDRALQKGSDAPASTGLLEGLTIQTIIVFATETKMYSKSVMLAVCTFICIGCESAESEDIRTGGMYPNMAVVNDGTSSEADVIIRVGGPTSNTFVNLTAGDTLAVSVNDGDSVTMSENNLGDYYQYSATFTESEEDTKFTFILMREDDESAPESVATLPAPFSLSGPEADTLFSRAADDITVTWTPSGKEDNMTLLISGDCLNDEVDISLEDTGSYVINAGTLELEEDDDKFEESCSGTITVRRTRAGSVDPAFEEGGTVTATQVRSVAFRSDP
jgi:hypothetical protein